MTVDKRSYAQFVEDLKKQILQRRYQAAPLANKELLFLYYLVCMAITEKIKKENWGNSVIETLSADLQKILPGLRGFSPKKSAEHAAIL